MHLSLPFFSTIFLHGLVNAATSPGCGKPLPHGHRTGSSYYSNITTDDGHHRTYLIHIPSSYQSHQPAPLILSFHGRGKDPEYMEDLSQFSNETWNPNGIAVYPQAIVDDYWHVTSGPNDISFTLQLLTHLEKNFCIDASRIYASGKSNGGGFTNDLACDPIASTRIAAFAPVSGGYYQSLPSPNATCNASTVPIACNPSRKPIPIIEFHGAADTTIPYAGGARHGQCLPSVSHFAQDWAVRNELPTKTRNHTEELFGGRVQEYRFGAEMQDGVITQYRIEGLKHVWPSTGPNRDNSVHGTYLDATPLIMRFFERWAF